MRILFQGDSVTDAGRDFSDYHKLGPGYAGYAAEEIRRMFPDQSFEFINLGIGGQRTGDLMARWQTDCVDLQPDLVSILIGINDTWRRFDSDMPTSAAQFESNYRSLLEDIKTKTHAKILMLEPFLLPVWPRTAFWRFDLDEKIQVVRKLAREYADAYLPLDGLLAAHLEQEPSYWTVDGIHPNEAGAKLIGSLYANAAAALIRE